MSAASGGTTSSARAVNKACERCVRRKAKCSGTDPCIRCLEADTQCSYVAAQKRGPKRKHANGEREGSTPQTRSSSVVPSRTHPTRTFSVDMVLPPSLREDLHNLCQAFVTVSWPIIYTPALPSLVSLSESRPILYNAMLLSCTAIAPRDARSSIASAREHLLQTFSAHLEAHGGLNCTEPSLPLIQALLFATSFYAGAGKMLIAWNHCGLACRMALSMNLHQSSVLSGKKLGRIEEQEVRRTFWGLYIMEQVVSYLMRLPPMLRAEDADRELPDIEEKDEYELWLNEHPQTFISSSQAKAMEGVRTHSLSSFLAWVQVMKEHESIRKDLRRDVPSGTGDFERLYNQRSQRLQAFKDQLPTHLQWHSPYLDPICNWDQFQDFNSSFVLALESHRGVAPQVLLMRAWYSECCILLHRPCVSESAQGSYSARQCLCAATEVCAIVSAYDLAFGINMMQSGFVHIIFQSATLLAAMESVYRIYGPDFWTPRLPPFPIAILFNRCVLWLQKLAERFSFANHYTSILASISITQAQSVSSQPSAPNRNPSPVKYQVSSPSAPSMVALTSPHSFEQPSGNSQPAISKLPDDFWDIVPFDGENLDEWLSSIEAYVPN
jgi:hypothetical protein